MLLVAAGSAHQAAADQWKTLKEDGVHDPGLSALEVLQNPGDALRVLPRDTVGNKVDWGAAIEHDYIKPRGHLSRDERLQILDQDIVMKRTGEMPHVVFSHARHTARLDCKSCHDAPFKQKAGATEMTMLAILRGEYCGICHGTVSFPLSECQRCHMQPLADAQRNQP